MPQFQDDRQSQMLADARAKEIEDIAELTSHKYKLPYINLTKQPLSVDAISMIDETTARDAHIAAFMLSGMRIAVGTSTPNDSETKVVIEGLEKQGYDVIIYFVSEPGLEKAFEAYKDISGATRTRGGVVEISEENIENYTKAISNLEEAKAAVDETLETDSSYRVTKIIEVILAGGLALKISDVHIEPEEGKARLRYRLDGMLSEVTVIDVKTYRMLVSRIKLISGLKLNIKNEPQDGRFTISLAAKSIEIRVSSLPGENGESIVMRLLDPDSLEVPLEELGMHPTVLDIMAREIRRPNGMILNTGPTGSGKTTTLYAFLKHVNSPEIKIVTIENPVEYHLDGIVQTGVSEGGLSFAEGLRSIVRQDPDVILVGEIRDSETARIAVQAAMTGHLVFSTLHTNTAAGTFPRLIDLGVDPKTLGAALNITMAQRLVRKLCPNCRQEKTMSEDERHVVDSLLADLPETIARPETTGSMFEAVGCDECFGQGYRGRIGIFDVVIANDEIEELLHTQGNPSERDILDVSRKQGILSMKQDAVLKILDGTTTLEEVRRVIDL